MSTQPLYSARKGSVSIAIFDGNYGKNAVVQKSYLKKDGDASNSDDWVRSSINLFLNELPQLKEVVDTIVEEAAEDIEKSQKRE